MQYIGGKHRQSKKISEFIKKVLDDNTTYVEPMVGVMGVAQKVRHSKMILSDVSKCLITLHTKLRNPRFVLPDFVTEEEYKAVKAVKADDDWRTAFYGFGLSFGGKFFAGYARGRDNNYAACAKRNLEKKRNDVFFSGLDVILVNCSYESLIIPERSVIYCDPPYKSTTKGHNFDDFDSDLFWEWCRKRVADGHIVLATEFTVPDDFAVLHYFGDTTTRHHKTKGTDGTKEVLVCHNTQTYLFI